MDYKRIKHITRRARQRAIDYVSDNARQASLTLREGHSSEYTNEKEIRIVGLRRAGNHAVIQWIRRQLPENHVFINCCRTSENPFRDVYRDQLLKRREPERRGHRYEDIDWWRDQSRGKLSYKDCLIYSFEDQELEKIKSSLAEKEHDLFLGKSEQRYDVIIMRDPFNLIASTSRVKASENWRNA